MAKIPRYQGDLEAFGSNAVGQERIVFGDTGTTQSDDLTDNINSDFLRGWAALALGNKPPREWFNSVHWVSTQLSAYLHQMGIAEWHVDQEYYAGSKVTHKGITWELKASSDVGTEPELGSVWLQMSEIKTSHIKQLDDVPLIDFASYKCSSFYSGFGVGGGSFIYIESADKADHNGITVIDPDRIAAWSGNQNDLSTYFTVGSGSGCFIRIDADFITPEMAGAVGDGVTNDTTALAAALSIKGHLVCDGDYIVDSATGVSVSSNKLINGSGSITTNSFDPNKIILNLDGKTEITIDNLQFKSLRNGDTIAVDNTAISGVGCSRINITNCNFDSFGYYAVYMRNATRCKVIGNSMTNLGRAGFLGLGCNQCHVWRNYISDVSPGSGGVAPFINAFGIVFSMVESSGEPRSSYCSAVGNTVRNVPSWEAFDTHGGRDLLFAKNNIENCAIGVFVGSATGTSNTPPERIKVIGNTFDNTTNAISRAAVLISGTPDAGVTTGDDIVVSDNIIRGYGTHDVAETQEGAIDVGFVRMVNIVNNSFYQNRYAHIRLKEDLIGCVITGNTFRRGLAVDGQIWVINAQNAADINAIFEGNVAYREGGTLNGIWVQASPSGTNFGLRVGVNEFNDLTNDFEASTISRLHESSEIFLITSTQCKVSPTGVIRNQKNVASVNKTGTGTYEVNLSSPYLSANNINAVSSGVGGSARICNATPSSASLIEVNIFDATGAAVDSEFQLIVSGKITEMI